MGYYSAINKNKIMPFAATLDGLRDFHTKWSKSDRERQIWYCLYMKSKKMVQMNLFLRHK